MKKHAANYENVNFRVGFVIKLKIHWKIRKYKLKLMAGIHFMIIYSLWFWNYSHQKRNQQTFSNQLRLSCQCQMSISTDSPVSFTSESWRRKLSMVHHNKISDVVVLRLRKTFSAMHLDYWLLRPAANSHSKFRQCLQPEKTHTKLADDISNNIYPLIPSIDHWYICISSKSLFFMDDEKQ
jgi:hypothetical protein